MSNGTAGQTEVTVVDIQIPFGSMVVLILKWALAAIPALLILSLVGLAITAVFGGLFWMAE